MTRAAALPQVSCVAPARMSVHWGDVSVAHMQIDRATIPEPSMRDDRPRPVLTVRLSCIYMCEHQLDRECC